MAIRLKRVYEAPDDADGTRILVDRLWPRGVSRAGARIDRWERDVAPSDALRRWFGHDPARWAAFRERYRAELRSSPAALQAIAADAAAGTVTLLYAARDPEQNNAVVLKEFIEDAR